MISELRIRPYRESDRPFLRTLYLAARKYTWTWLEDIDYKLEDFDRAVIGEKILVAEQDGHLLGFASYITQESFLHNLFIDPQYQGMGAGSALLNAAENAFTHTGSLKCLVKSEKAVRFYLSRGWNIVATGESPKGEYYLFYSSNK